MSQQRTAAISKYQRNRNIWAYIFITPQIIVFFGLSIYPIVMSYVYSFYDWSGIGPLNDFVGFKNYIRIIKEPSFWNAFKNTFIYTFWFTIISLSVSLVLALILNNPLLKGRGVYRVIYFLPVVTTMAIIGIIMQNIFGNQGFVNELFKYTGIISESIPWLSHPTLAMMLLVIVGSWKEIGITMIYWLAGLQMIPREVYEAAKIDGASPWQTLKFITLPLLKPIGATILLLTVVSSMHVFDLVRTLTEGGPYFATETLELFIYRYAFAPDGPSQVGYASAAGVVLGLTVFIMSLFFGWIVYKVTGKRNKALGGGLDQDDE